MDLNTLDHNLELTCRTIYAVYVLPSFLPQTEVITPPVWHHLQHFYIVDPMWFEGRMYDKFTTGSGLPN